jgi:acyl-coenzyme A synthetase/AMP-(fatty) acid ligase
MCRLVVYAGWHSLCVCCPALLQVLEAAVVGIPHAKWGERPLLVVVPQPQYAPGEHMTHVT